MIADETLAAVADEAARDAGGVPVEYLGDFLPVLVAAVDAGTPLPAARLRAYRSLGERAARRGVALRALLDLYLSAAWRVWPELPAVQHADRRPQAVVAAGQVMLHAADDVVAQLTEGFQLARRALVRAQEAARREFIDDLLGGAADVVGLLHRATGFGLDLAGPHAVAVISADRPFDDGEPLLTRLERAILGRKGDAQALLATKDGRLVVVFPAPDRAAVEQVSAELRAGLESARPAVGAWRLGLGRAAVGADGVLTSYREAGEAVAVAATLQWPEPVVAASDLLVYRVLLQNRAALADVVAGGVGGLASARGGAAPLVETLAAWFDTGNNLAATARALHLSVRAVAYRLQRVRELTGLDPDSPADRFTLQVAVLGQRLLSRATDDTQPRQPSA